MTPRLSPTARRAQIWLAAAADYQRLVGVDDLAAGLHITRAAAWAALVDLATPDVAWPSSLTRGMDR